MPKNPHGVFCLETIWFDEAWNPSARPLLELLERMSGVPLVHRDVSTWEELDFCLGRWVGRNMLKMPKKDYRLGHLGILYLGFHGSPGKIYLRTDSRDSRQKTDDDEVDLCAIAESLTKGKPLHDATGGVIHFGSCSVLRAPRRVREFKDKVGAACVSGYSKQVDTTPSWAFEFMYLDLLSQLLSTKEVNAGTLGTLENKIGSKEEYKGLANALGFKMIY